MRTAFDHFASHEHQDLIGIADCAQTMGNDKAGATFKEYLQRLLDQALSPGVHARSSLIQDHDSGICQCSAGNRDKLALSLTEAATAFAEDRLITLR